MYMLYMSGRKLIAFGKNSYVISLPKNWIQRNNLKKGDEITVEETFDMIVLSTQGNDIEEIKIKKINIDEDLHFSRKIISAYVNNYDQIEIKGNNLSEHFESMRQATQGMLALEIMEFGSKKVLMKDFLNTSDISLDSILKRIDMMIRSMIEEIKESVITNTKINLDERDKDINKMFYVANKLLNKVLDKPKLAKDLGIPIKEVLFKWRVLVSFETIGDQLKRIIRNFNDLKEDKEKKQILKTFIMIAEEYLLVVKALYKMDKISASNILDNKSNLLTECEKLLDLIYNDEKKQTKHVLNIATMSYKLKIFENYVCNIAKAIITTE